MTDPITPASQPGGTQQPAGQQPPAGSATPPAAAPGTETTPQATPEREGWIPRQRFDEVNSELAYYRALHQGDGAGEPRPAATEQPAEDAVPATYGSWDEWHAADPGSAIDWRSRQAYKKEQAKTEFSKGREQFLSEVFSEDAALKDPAKRAGHPVYQNFARLLQENPPAGASYKGLKQLWKLAKVEAGQTPDAIMAARAAGEQTEQARQAAAAATFAPTGTGTTPASSGATEPQLTPDQQKIASRYGMSAKEYLDRCGDVLPGRPSPGRIPMKYEKAKRG